jgi:hypothetical protein
MNPTVEMAIPVKQQALTRLKFDDFHQIDDARITSYALRYYVNPPEANCPTSFPVDATTRIQKSGNSWPQGRWRTDVESDLKGINRFGSRVKCDDDLYNPETNTMNRTPLRAAPDESFPLVFNRLYNPPCTLRATGWNRFDSVPHQPQLTFETPFDFYIPSKMLDKENCKTH